MAYILDQNGSPILDENSVGLWDEDGQPETESPAPDSAMMITVREIAQLASASVPGCNYLQSEAAVRESIIEFCELTWTLERHLAFSVPAAGISASPFYRARVDMSDENTAEQVRPLALQSLSVEGSPRMVSKARLVGTMDPSDMLGGHAKFYDMPGDEYLDIFPLKETAPVGLNMKVAMTPVFGFTQVDKLYFYTHRRAILDGAISYLYEIPNKSWSNERAAKRYRMRFDSKVVDAKIVRATESGGQNQQANLFHGGWP